MGGEDSFVVVVDDLFCIVHAAVTNFDCVSVKNSAELMIFGEVFVNQREEFMCDVSAGVRGERRVVPEDVVALAVLATLCVCWQVAIKEITLDPNKKNRTKEAVLKEASILAHLKHPHVVSLQEYFFDSSEELLCIVQDFCDGGTLQDQIVNARESYKIPKYFRQFDLGANNAVVYSNDYGSATYSLQESTSQVNFEVMADTLYFQSDFGIARMMENTFDMAQTCCGTPCYLSPELCQDMPYSSKADVWVRALMSCESGLLDKALGCLLFEMCALRYAFDATNFVSLFYKIVKVDHGDVPSQYSSSLEALIKQLLAKSPDDRPSAGAILNLPFVQKHLAIFIKEKENLQESLHVKQLLKTPAGSSNTSPSMPQRPSSATGIKSPDVNRKLTKLRCKSAQPMDRWLQPIPTEEKKGITQVQDVTNAVTLWQSTYTVITVASQLFLQTARVGKTFDVEIIGTLRNHDGDAKEDFD
ncbi:Serine/threonine-protein kinase Nek1 [Stylophora pistillata]|uniref:non-specific serine/threonine protein kinase n=1 Tax=Stylophora pistillata TaxID=50429 RepID=A0A2B4RLU1_STYPI|nr:Serine/threonine-protein kinase Nek1 [Stylophora pistillata]